MAQQQQQQKAAAAAAAKPGNPSAPSSSAPMHKKPAVPPAAPRPMGPPQIRPSGLPAAGVKPIPKPIGAPSNLGPRPPTSAPQSNLNATAAAAAAAKKRKADAVPLDKIALSIPECEAFNQLLEAQMSIDAEIRRCQSEIQQAHQLSMSRNLGPCDPFKAILRLYVHSTHANQPTSKTSVEPPSWVLFVTGRIVDPVVEEAQASAIALAEKAGVDPDAPLLLPPPSLMPKNIQPGTSYMRRVEVRLDPEQYPGDQGLIVWDRSRHIGPFKDQLEVRRIGDRACHATVLVDVDHLPPKYKVNARLAALIEVECDTKAKVLRALVAYLAKRQRRQRGESFFKSLEETIALPDDLKALLVGPNGNGTINVKDLGALIEPLLSKADPLVIHHEIKVDGPKHHAPDCYDVEIDLPITSADEATNANASPSSLGKLGHAEVDAMNASYEKKLEDQDQKLSATLKKINELRRRRTLLRGFAEHPKELISSFVAIQGGREIRVGRGNTGSDFEVERRSNLFTQPWATEATSKYLFDRQSSQNQNQ